jgi:HPt (histidine-containing phosphotransfer) domain-containing protein
VINLYLSESPKLVQKLTQAANESRPTDIARAAHSLKSSSANVGAKVLSGYCQDVESSAGIANTEEARRIVEKIESEHGRVQAALAAECELLPAAKA